MNNVAIFAKRTTLHNGYGGLETQTKALAEGLVRKGYKVTIFSPKHEHAQHEVNENGVKYVFVNCVYRMGPVFGFFGTMQKSNWINRSVEEFEKFHNKDKFNIVLAQSSSGLGVIKKKWKFDVPIISIAHGSILGEYNTFLKNIKFPGDIFLFIKNTGFIIKNFFRRQREFVHGSDKVICVSRAVKTALIDETFAPEEKFKVINNGIDPRMFEGAVENRGNKCLYVGKVFKSKGMDDIYKVFSKLTYEIDIIGDGDYLEELNEQIMKNNIKNIRIIGNVPYKNVIKDYFMNSKYGVFVFPTKRVEGFPMVLVEAMFAGLPVVAYDMGGVSDAVEDGVTGYLIQKGNVNEFKSKLIDVLENKDLGRSLSTNSMRKARENYTIEIMLKKYLEVINEVIK